MGGTGLPQGAALTINPREVTNGRLGVLFDSSSPMAVGARQIVRVRFNVAADAPAGSSTFSFGSSPTPRSWSSALGELLPASYTTGALTITPSNTSYRVGGRVFTPSGGSLRNAVVSIIEAGATTRRSVSTNSAGYYEFDNVGGGRTYTISVSSRRYKFNSRVEPINSDRTDINFTATE